MKIKTNFSKATNPINKLWMKFCYKMGWLVWSKEDVEKIKTEAKTSFPNLRNSSRGNKE